MEINRQKVKNYISRPTIYIGNARRKIPAQVMKPEPPTAGPKYLELVQVAKNPSPKRRSTKTKRYLGSFWNSRVRLAMGAGALLIIITEIMSVMQPFMNQNLYALGQAGSLLSPVNQIMAAKLKFDSKSQAYAFNAGYTPDGSDLISAANTQSSATAYQDPSKGIVVTDPVNKVDFTMTPEYKLDSGQQDGNRVIYPLSNGAGWAVYTMHSIGVKEDVLLNKSTGNTASLVYNLGLGSSLKAKLEVDGSIGVYGNTLFSGNVSTSTAKDADLLQKARQNAPKNTLLFRLPKPTVKETGKAESKIKASYKLDGNNLIINVSGLQKAHYPISIDPSIYVTTAQQFMNGNNETNIDFDVADALIQKGKTTGARFNSWNSTTSLPVGTWNGGSVAAGGFMYTLGGTSLNGQIYTSAGTSTYTVPAAVTTVTVKAWGGGGGGASGNGSSGLGGAGGGSGFAQADLTVSPGQVLNITVGSGGIAGTSTSNGGNGGGYSSVQNISNTYLVQAGGGGGGGGGRSTGSGGAGGAGGGASGVAGGSGTGGGGGAGTNAAGGTAGTAGTGGVAGAAGAANGGGDAGGSVTSCSTAVSTQGGAGGFGAGGNGGAQGSCEGGGGGGGGRFGGGGGGSASNSGTRTGGGGGGGSDLVTGANTSQTAGSGVTPGNNADSYNNGAGTGGNGSTTTTPTNGTAGLIVIFVTGSAFTTSSSVNWSQFDTSNGGLDAPNPGSGACSGWCTTSAYNLPAARAGFSVVAYNGFLYVLGGVDSAGSLKNTVYVTKLGANGEPQLWDPTDSNKANWHFWYTSANTLPDNIAYGAAVAYNNRLYILGGKSTTNPNGDAIVREADLKPTGDIGSWTSTGMTQLSSGATARFGLSAQVYNDRIYVIGGNNAGTLKNDVYYMKLASDGTMSSSNWTATSSFTGARMTWGGTFTTVWGAYIYISGGCGAVNGSGYCTSIDSDTQLASINADGSIDAWATNSSVSDSRMGYSLVAWRSYIYEVGGCTAQDASTGNCTNILSTIKYGTINQDGDASTVNTSVASGVSPCSGGSPTNCNLPPTGTGSGTIGQILNPTAILNGYLYVIGGCRATSGDPCGSVSSNTAYASINSTGQLTAPTSCVADGNTLVGAWCVDSSHAVGSGIAAAGTAVFGGRIYLVGGFNTGTNVYYNSLNNDGSLGGAWSSVTLASIGTITTLTYDYAFARANPSSAGTNPGNLYIMGGCTDGTVGCSNYTNTVYKCNINTSGVPGGCSTGSQMQINNATDPNNGNADCGSGLGAMAGTVYANYLYLIGGLTPNCTDLTTLRYAKIDNSNNIVAVSGGTWIQSTMQTHVGRRRGAAFGYNGYIYVVGGYDAGSGLLDDIEFAKINVSDGSIVDQSGGSNLFNVSSVTLDQSRWGLSVPVSNSYAYVIGGCVSGNAPTCNANSGDATITTFQIYNNDAGTPAAYSTSANTYSTAGNRIGLTSAVYNGYIYVAGGCTAADCTSLTNNVSYAALDAVGGVGSWSSTTANLPASRAWGKLLAAGGSLYYVGGMDTNYASQTTVYYGTPSSGNVTTWSTASNGLPASRAQFGAAVWNNRLYVVGGSSGAGYTLTYQTAGGSSFTIPTGVTTMTVKAWGAGGGGGSGSGSSGVGGAGAGGGFAQATITVAGGDVLSINVGSAGAAANGTSRGGNGGGYSNIVRSGTTLIQAGGGGGGGGAMSTGSGGAGGAGGGSSGVAGSNGSGTTPGGGGGAGTNAAGGTAGTAGTAGVAGNSGAANNGGDGGGFVTNCTTAVGSRGGNGGTGAGGAGGTAATCASGGGGGGGRFGGGGGGSVNNTTRGGGGGGGGSDLVTGSSTTETAGSGVTPGNSTDSYIASAGQGGAGTTAAGAATAGTAGTIEITFGSPTYNSTVYVSPQQSAGGDIASAWSSTSTSFNIGRNGLTAIAYANNLYVLGGYDGSNYLSDVQFASIGYKAGTISQSGTTVTGSGTTFTSSMVGSKIQYPDGSTANITAFGSGTSLTVDVSKTVSAGTVYVVQDGSVGSWTYSTSLPGATTNADGFAVDGYMYVMGGASAPYSCTPQTLVSPISANTTIATDNNPTGVGAWYETNATYSGNRMGNAAAYNDGKAYVLGGACFGTFASPVTVQTALLTQPQVAKYSIMIDTDSDVFPNQWLLNGVDNSVGANWQLRYRSMTNTTTSCTGSPMTTWGLDTNFGNVSLGVPGVYNVLDGSGTNIHCGRFFYFFISVDSSQAFGYPDDVSRGPTITDLTLQFTADPSKRLMHGRTFTGGLQQPDDTPYYTH